MNKQYLYNKFTYFYNNVVVLLGLITVHIHLNIDKTLGCRLYLMHVPILLTITVALCILSSAYYLYDKKPRYRLNLIVDALSFICGGFLVLYTKGTNWLGSLCLNASCSLQEQPFALLCFILGDFMVFGSVYRLCIYMWDTKNSTRNIVIVIIGFIIIAGVYLWISEQ